MKTETKVEIMVGVILALVFFWGLGIRNQLVHLKEDVNLQQAQIETTLQRRADLIPQLVETVKGYMAHEEHIFTEIANARIHLTDSISTGNIETMAEADTQLKNAYDTFLAVVVEDYPELEAISLFVSLQDEIAGTENRILRLRQTYNESVQAYNIALQEYPTNIVARLLGYHLMDYFEASSDSYDAPIINFS